MATLAALALLAARLTEVDAARLWSGLPRVAAYLGRTIPQVRAESWAADLAEWFWGWRRWALLLLDTALIGYVGTALGAALALALSFPAASNCAAARWHVTLARRTLEVMRSVPVLVFALVYVFAFGLGPLAGTLALATHSAGALGKLFAEAHENVQPGPMDATRACGGGWAQTMRWGVLPQSIPTLTSYTLLRLEINVREASVLGFVGAGGIGQELYLVVRRFEYTDISALVLMILCVVSAMDVACARLRRRLLRG